MLGWRNLLTDLFSVDEWNLPKWEGGRTMHQLLETQLETNCDCSLQSPPSPLGLIRSILAGRGSLSKPSTSYQPSTPDHTQTR